ncbi:BnaA05g16580D [Brassica napus]|uniref:BnaA05g16580D protein n=1 Tax=Brassica napus TaxID=3708 RepID=A0A078HFF3_BRANA|nr:BnaA05g16580D [Brassica napus]
MWERTHQILKLRSTDKRANESFAGIAIGATIVLDILFSGPVSGASMNPARSLGPEYIWGCYKDLWLYIVSTVIGGLACAWTYNMLRSTNKSYGEIVRPYLLYTKSNKYSVLSLSTSTYLIPQSQHLLNTRRIHVG